MSDAAAKYRSGLIYGLIAYLWWGLVPLYFAELKHHQVSAWEILAHRITWSLPIMLVITWLTGGWEDIFRVLGDRRLVLTLLLSSLFLAINWLLYIYATITNQVAEASLGYFVMPLVNAALATFFLGERLRPAHYPALTLVAVGVSIPFVVDGIFTWLAIVLPVSFGFYGLVRKQVAVESSTGLTVETLLMVGPSLAFLVYLWVNGTNHMGSDLGLDSLIIFSGIVTVVPLLTFTLSIRRLPLLAISFIQFLSPAVQMLIAVLWLQETLSHSTIAAFICIGLAVMIFIGDSVAQGLEARKMDRRRTAQLLESETTLVPPLPVRR